MRRGKMLILFCLSVLVYSCCNLAIHHATTDIEHGKQIVSDFAKQSKMVAKIYEQQQTIQQRDQEVAEYKQKVVGLLMVIVQLADQSQHQTTPQFPETVDVTREQISSAFGDEILDDNIQLERSPMIVYNNNGSPQLLAEIKGRLATSCNCNLSKARVLVAVVQDFESAGYAAVRMTCVKLAGRGQIGFTNAIYPWQQGGLDLKLSNILGNSANDDQSILFISNGQNPNFVPLGSIMTGIQTASLQPLRFTYTPH